MCLNPQISMDAYLSTFFNSTIFYLIESRIVSPQSFVCLKMAAKEIDCENTIQDGACPLPPLVMLRRFRLQALRTRQLDSRLLCIHTSPLHER
jgi:hypothetical protein